MAGSINKLINTFENKIKDKPVKTGKNTAVFKSRKVKLQKTDTNSTHITNNHKKSKTKAKNKVVDYDIKGIAGIKSDFKDKLEMALAAKPKKTGMISPKRNQKAVSNKKHLQSEEKVIVKQQDLAIQPISINNPADNAQAKIPTPPPVPPITKHKNNKSLKANINYQRKNNWDEISASNQERQNKGIKATPQKTKQSQDVQDELAKVLEKRNKS